MLKIVFTNKVSKIKNFNNLFFFFIIRNISDSQLFNNLELMFTNNKNNFRLNSSMFKFWFKEKKLYIKHFKNSAFLKFYKLLFKSSHLSA